MQMISSLLGGLASLKRGREAGSGGASSPLAEKSQCWGTGSAALEGQLQETHLAGDSTVKRQRVAGVGAAAAGSACVPSLKASRC